jgi:hypothetical protein
VREFLLFYAAAHPLVPVACTLGPQAVSRIDQLFQSGLFACRVRSGAGGWSDRSRK